MFTLYDYAGLHVISMSMLQVKYVLLINCGGTLDLVDILQPEPEIVFFILDRWGIFLFIHYDVPVAKWYNTDIAKNRKVTELKLSISVKFNKILDSSWCLSVFLVAELTCGHVWRWFINWILKFLLGVDLQITLFSSA